MASVDIAALYASGMSLPDIERETGIHRSTVRCRLLRAGIKLRPRADAIRMSPKIGQHMIGKTREHSEETKQALSRARIRWADGNARGKSEKASGYVVITRGEHKHRGEHVVIMESRIGRRLLRDEVVHHIDGNRSNNSIDNLALMTRAAHARLHRREERLSREAA